MKKANMLVVGIGASAGGIQALKGFFSEMPDDPGMAFVIVTHLSPSRVSLLHEVIARFTQLRVEVVHDGDPVRSGVVHVMPENAVLSIRDGCLRLIEIDMADRERKPVDVFLSALAVDQGENAVGIILSGGDGDGTLGIKAIKENGGFTFAQTADGDGPANPEMPTSAITSGLVDFELPVDRMAERLVQIRNGEASLAGLLRRGAASAPETEHGKMQREISALLRSHSGHDFGGYKSRTFFRRVARRMQVVQSATLEDYLALLNRESAEVMALFRDLLISVTDFFRDTEAFEQLAGQVIPKLLEGRGANETVRIWVPGCATGEEVYSLAILMREALTGMSPRPQVQIFATDIDEPALGVARAARYPEERLRNVSPERRERFFRKEGASNVLARDVRDMCIFSPHNVISDPPFSRMDMVSCRNLLIYLGPDLQHQVIPTFHYALKPGGYLFLGTSEGISQHEDLFTPLDKKQRIFQSRNLGERRKRLPVSIDTAAPTHQRFEQPDAGTRLQSHRVLQRVESQIMDRHAPAHVVIRKEGDIVFYSGRTGPYFETPRGAPNRQLFDLLRRELRLDLRSALRETLETTRPAIRHAMMLTEEKGQTVALTVEPLDGDTGGEALFLVLFRVLGSPREGLAAAREVTDSQLESEANARELRDVGERMRSTVEEYETALEELKSSNEELISVNEEAQSSNEELQATKEEMQSLNEELSTVNAELNDRVDELDRANVDLTNLYEATGIATVFLDRHLMIRNFTPAAFSFFNLRRSDIGRPLTELASAIDYPDLKDDIRQVFETGEMVERRLPPNGHSSHHLVRLVPYLDQGQTTGVVVTFLEITSLAKAEEHQNILIAELNHRVKNMLAVVLSITSATHRKATSIAGFAESLTARFQSMARAYGLLSNRYWTEVPLHDLVQQEVAAFGENRIRLEGPEVMVAPEQALSLGMVIHEVATNAAKHGALSTSAGTVAISWRVEADRLHVDWTESDGPQVSEPSRRGFGLDLLQGLVEGQLGGSLTTSFPREGFRLEMEMTLTNALPEQEG